MKACFERQLGAPPQTFDQLFPGSAVSSGSAAITGLIVPVTESPRVSRRLNTLRGLSHEQVEQVLARGA